MADRNPSHPVSEREQDIAARVMVHRASIVKLVSSAAGVRLQIALLVVQTLGLNVKLVPRGASVDEHWHGCCQRCVSRGHA